MTYNVTFNTTLISKSLEDYGLFLEDVDLGSPEAQTAYVQVPGRNGALDMSEAITGYTTYNNRQMAFILVGEGSIGTIEALRDEIMTDLHGQTVEVYPEWVDGYYKGRATVSVDAYRPNFIRLNVTVEAEPYRYDVNPVTVSLITGANTVTNGGALPIVPDVITTEETTITFNGDTYTVQAGTYTIPGIVLMPGDNDLTVSAAATLEYTEGHL